MKRWAFGIGVAVMAFAPAAAMAQPAFAQSSPGDWLFGTDWEDDFDDYSDGDNLHGVGGWLGWDDTADATGFVSSAEWLSPPHSVAIDGTGPGNVVTDLVQEFTTGGTGTCILSVDTYFPAGSTGIQFFIMLNRYAANGPKNWSTQTRFNHATGEVSEADTGIPDRSGRIDIVYDVWAPIVMVIDLDADTVSFSYNGQVLFANQPWQQSGDRDIGAIDLWSNNATVMYYDNFVFTQIPDCVVCDMNCDDEINSFDIENFLDLLFNPAVQPCCGTRAIPGHTGDVNRDGVINAFDIDPFLECLFGP